MPKNLKEEIIFTIMMVLVMVYFMIFYNISLSTGGAHNWTFIAALKELVIMAPIAFILDFFIVGKIAKKKTFSIINPERDNPFFIVLGISCISILLMCPLMSFVATLLFKNAGMEIIPVWMETTVLNFPMAFFLQLCFAGPVVRKLFGLIIPQK